MRRAFTYSAEFAVAASLLLCLGCSGSDTPTPKAKGPDEQAPAEKAPDPSGSAKTRLVGVWKGEAPPEYPAGDPKPQIEFKDDGTVDMWMFGLGTWKLVRAEGNKLIINTVTEMVTGAGGGRSLKDGVTTETTKIETQKLEQEYSIVFETDDRIVMTPTDNPSMPMTFNRTTNGE